MVCLKCRMVSLKKRTVYTGNWSRLVLILCVCVCGHAHNGTVSAWCSFYWSVLKAGRLSHVTTSWHPEIACCTVVYNNSRLFCFFNTITDDCKSVSCLTKGRCLFLHQRKTAPSPQRHVEVVNIPKTNSLPQSWETWSFRRLSLLCLFSGSSRERERWDWVPVHRWAHTHTHL